MSWHGSLFAIVSVVGLLYLAHTPDGQATSMSFRTRRLVTTKATSPATSETSETTFVPASLKDDPVAANTPPASNAPATDVPPAVR